MLWSRTETEMKLTMPFLNIPKYLPCTSMFYVLMSVLLVMITATLMLPVTTLLVASPVPVIRDTKNGVRWGQM